MNDLSDDEIELLSTIHQAEEYEHQQIEEPMNNINEIAAALAKAQCEMQNPKFDAANPHFKNKFASLAAVRDAVVPCLAKHGIAVVQNIVTSERATDCTTIFYHISGQSLTFGPLSMPTSKADAQGYGSAATYARRYALMAACCVVGDADDDANAATGKEASKSTDASGDVSHIAMDKAKAVADGMRTILASDIHEEMKMAAVLDRLDELNKDQELYTAAWNLMGSKERSAWKQYVAMGKKTQESDRVMRNGRAA